MKTFLEKVRKVVKENQGATAGHLILQLNPLIRGWARYHQHVVSKEIFQDVDSAIFEMLWQWARKRHNNKPRRWIKDKYFQDHEGRHWVFSGVVIGREGALETVRLFRAAQTPIKRHVKLQGAANPFDPAWEVYFEKRLGVKMEDTFRGKRQLLALWKQQKGLVPSMSSTDHQADRVAQPPQSLAIKRRRGSVRKPCVVASNLPPTAP